MLAGVRGRCPRCGEGRLFDGFLKPAPACRVCGQSLMCQRADDFPAYIVILVTGHVLVPIVVACNGYLTLSTGVQMVMWPVIAGAMALAMIRPVKGAVIALQWARRMHGF